MVTHVNATDDQYLAVHLDLSRRLRYEAPLPGRNPARLQRAPKSPGESPGGRGHDVVQRRGVGLVNVEIHSIMPRDL